MHPRLPRSLPTLLLPAAILLASSALADPPTPPPGPVTSTMKRLDQIEPRTDIASLAATPDAVRLIDHAGNYFLSADLQGEPNKHGILITASGRVSLDLNGFSLHGVPSSLNGIHIIGAGGSTGAGTQVIVLDSRGIQARSGEYVAGGSSIDAFGGDGCHCEATAGFHISGVSISHAGGNGIDCRGGGGGGGSDLTERITILGCAITHCAGNGISCSSTGGVVPIERIEINGASVVHCGGDGITIDSAQFVDVIDSALNYIDDGIRIANTSTVTLEGLDIDQCAAVGLHIDHATDATLSSSRISNCGSYGVEIQGGSSAPGTPAEGRYVLRAGVPIRFCASTGVYIQDFASVQLSGVSVSECSGRGIHLDGGSSASSTATLEDCSASSNSGHGFFTISARDTYGNCRVSSNGLDGFHSDPLAAAAIIPRNILKSFRQCSSSGNGGHGYYFQTGDRPTQSQFANVIDSDASFNTGDGFHFETGDIPTQNDFADVIDSFATSNGGDGFEFIGSSASLNGCSSSQNGGDGIAARERINQLETRLKNIGLLACTVSGSGGDGIDVTGGTLSVRQCTVSDSGLTSPVPAAAALKADKVTGVTVTDLTARNSTGSGVAFTNPGSVTISKLSVSQCNAEGLSIVRLDSSSPPLVTINEPNIDRAGGSGIYCTGAGNVTISNGHIDGSGGDGIVVASCTGLKMLNTATSNNSAWGLHCDHTNIAAVLNGNVVIGNGLSGAPGGGGGAVFNNCGAVRIEGSDFSGNTGRGINVGINEVLPFATLHVSRVTASANTDAGIGCFASGGGGGGGSFSSVTIRECDLSNSGFGIACETGVSHAVVESNTCTGNGGGIYVADTGNFIRRNSVTVGLLGSYAITMPGNTIGPTVDAGTIPTDCNEHSNVIR